MKKWICPSCQKSTCVGCEPFTLCEEGTPCFNLSCARLGCALDRQREADKHTGQTLISRQG
jgi:hypothetical protein